VKLIPLLTSAGVFLLLESSAFGQGSLAPPAAPTPTMKTLQQIQPRVDLQATIPDPSVTTSDPNYHYIITQPGSYYLSANLGVTKTNGIEINAEGVTLDLNGFQISRASGSGGSGIYIAPNINRGSIRNGSIKSFADGVQTDSSCLATALRDLTIGNCTSYGIYAGNGSIIESCRVHYCGGNTAIYCGLGSLLNNCTANTNTANTCIFANIGSSLINCVANFNTASVGILAGAGSSLSNCSASNNSAGIGIQTSTGCSLNSCTASSNTGSGPLTYGFFLDANCTIVGCTASSNTTNYGTPSNSTGIGIAIGLNSTAKNCTASSNVGDGIQSTNNCVISGCNASGNTNAASHGINAGTGCTITDCTASANGGIGISVNQSSTISHSTAQGNTGTGIVLNNYSSVEDCTASSNTGDGILIAGTSSPSSPTLGCTILNSNVSGNHGDGIHLSATYEMNNRVEGNNVSSNTGTGIHQEDGPDLITRNMSRFNGTNYSPTSGSSVGPISTSANTATSPWANFTWP